MRCFVKQGHIRGTEGDLEKDCVMDDQQIILQKIPNGIIQGSCDIKGDHSGQPPLVNNLTPILFFPFLYGRRPVAPTAIRSTRDAKFAPPRKTSPLSLFKLHSRGQKLIFSRSNSTAVKKDKRPWTLNIHRGRTAGGEVLEMVLVLTIASDKMPPKTLSQTYIKLHIWASL